MNMKTQEIRLSV